MRTTVVAVSLAAALGITALWARADRHGAVGSGGRVAAEPARAPVAATVTSAPLSTGECVGGFERHELDHVTLAADRPARLFDSNGAGVAVDDLDGDGRPDIVLGNLEGPNTILWNEGDWRFTTERMTDRATRAVQLVDVDADGRLDIVTTHRAGGVAAWKNAGARRFELLPLVGVGTPAYSMSWADVDADGDLDLATGSYDAELDQQLRSGFLFGPGAGVFVHRRGPDGFESTRLARTAQALVTSWLDLDVDGRPELFIGNDFAMHDMTWTQDGTAWAAIEPFTTTAAHTMSVDAGDIDSDGIEEIFATDMKPVSTDVEVLAAWMPLISTMDDLDRPDDAQRIRNVLQVPQADGTFAEEADRSGIDAAGWAWSARFGDLDNDGDVDLHVVNGMIAAETFSYLPRAELVEANVAFRNDGNGRFAVAPTWGLGDRASGRGSVLADLDADGRLDVIVNNLDSPAAAFRNRTCGAGALEVDLRWPSSGNTHAIGARVLLETSAGRQVRYIRSGAGYLSGSPSRLHFGLPAGAEVERMVVRWPDGRTTTVEAPAPATLQEVTRP